MRYRQRKERATIPEERRNGTERRNTVDTMSVLIYSVSSPQELSEYIYHYVDQGEYFI